MVQGRWAFYRMRPAWLLAYFTFVNILIYLDRGVLASVVPALKDADGLNLDSIEAGALGSIFMLGYMIASPLFATSAQKVHPFFLMAIGLSIWVVAVLMCGLSTSFGMLLVSRAVTGVGEASFVSLAPPMILDIAPTKDKAL